MGGKKLPCVCVCVRERERERELKTMLCRFWCVSQQNAITAKCKCKIFNCHSAEHLTPYMLCLFLLIS
jgi:hypothetical protein